MDELTPGSYFLDEITFGSNFEDLGVFVAAGLDGLEDQYENHDTQIQKVEHGVVMKGLTLSIDEGSHFEPPAAA